VPVTVVVGAQFGDEAKGKISDYLAKDYRYVVRTGGGPNAGHSIGLPQGKVVLHQVPCGVLRAGVTGICGPGMALNPTALEGEIRELEERGLLKGELILSERAQVILPIHELEDAWEEELRTSKDPKAGLGTTRRGIGPAYADRYGRWGLRLVDLVRPTSLRAKLELLYARKAHLPGLPPIDALQANLSEIGGRLAPRVQATEPILWEAIARKDAILLEGAQSALLDVNFGTYPYVTSSHPTSAGALVGSGIPPQELDQSIGVTKAYATRVGDGPFPTEVEGELGEHLRREGQERGATTGRPRRTGWLDLVLLRYAARLNGFTSLALTKVDVLGGLDVVPVCTQYVTKSGETLRNYPPAVAEELAGVSPVYERFPGWPSFTERMKERIHREQSHALPSSLKRFAGYVAAQVGVPVEWVSYGAGRDETLWLGRGTSTKTGPGLSEWS
jgi:adenylosuccinate synthase